MSRRNTKKATGARHIRLNHSLLETAAWHSLTCAQRCVYLALKSRFTGFNNGEVGLSARDAGHLANCNKDTAAKALLILAERGFIQRMRPGAFSYKKRHSAVYRLTNEEMDTPSGRQPATNEFQSWRLPRKKRGPKGEP